MGAIYNEIELYAATWLRNLEQAGHIAQGHVDERSIRELQPADVRDFTQAHFFAGIGVWSHALRLAGWPDELPVWTGSCPCQPFSGAGKRGGFSDDRHLWPDWFRLIRECRPPVVFGEQVASPDGYAWLDLVQADMEGAGYAFGAAVLPAAGVGAPHVRHRIYWVAYANESGLSVIRRAGLLDRERQAQRHDADGCGEARGVADATEVERGPWRTGEQSDGRDAARVEPDGLCSARGVGNADCPRRDSGAGAGPEGGPRLRPGGDVSRAPGPVGGVGDSDDSGLEGVTNGRQLVWARHEGTAAERAGTPGPTNGFWSRADWVPCRDGFSRPVEPGSFPLAHGAPARVGRLRAYGNAIVSEVAATFIRAAIHAVQEVTP